MAFRKMLTYFRRSALQFIYTREKKIEMENIKHSFLHHTMVNANAHTIKKMNATNLRSIVNLTLIIEIKHKKTLQMVFEMAFKWCIEDSKFDWLLITDPKNLLLRRIIIVYFHANWNFKLCRSKWKFQKIPISWCWLLWMVLNTKSL